MTMRVTIFLVLGMLLMSSLKVEVKAYCETNGCSIPGNLPLLYKDRFTSACNKHYVCYACGESNGWSRGQCDRAFKRDMESLCQRLNSSNKLREQCRKIGKTYYFAVRRAAGWIHYENPSLKWCESCPRYRGDPSSALGRL